MKSRFLLITLIAIALGSLGSNRFAAETHIITLNVDTGVIDDTNIDQTCNFGQGTEISNREFTVHARRGDIVLWQGVSSTAPERDEVLITSISYEEGVKIFNRNTLRDYSQNPGVVLGSITDGNQGDVNKYSVSFKVMNDGVQRGGTYEIDPKILITD